MPQDRAPDRGRITCAGPVRAPVGRLFESEHPGLLWQQSFATDQDWVTALQTCESLDYGGRTDWRLPSVLELRSIVDLTRVTPAVDPAVFPGIISGQWQDFLTSTTHVNGPNGVWVTWFWHGRVVSRQKEEATRSVRCVSSP